MSEIKNQCSHSPIALVFFKQNLFVFCNYREPHRGGWFVGREGLGRGQ